MAGLFFVGVLIVAAVGAIALVIASHVRGLISRWLTLVMIGTILLLLVSGSLAVLPPGRASSPSQLPPIPSGLPNLDQNGTN